MIWTIVTFVVVLIVLRLTAWNPILSALKEREQSIEGAIADAGRIQSEAEELLATYRTMIDKARDETRAILEEGRKDSLQAQEEIRKAALVEADEFKARARREIELQKDGAVREIWEQAADLSTELASRVIGRSLTGDDHRRLVENLITEMRTDHGGKAGKA
ncbi:MAG: F0F1 ATP synthase subunit B [Gemmatimonadota bacterium]|jgi:F-type H+-transporting ATPase subunit b|nr:ATP synthase F0 subunit B [Gemmatimonadota bacterium]MDP6528340.1 F0F1 ATP synthase subunit B [Gemmatimonadota bacterium]MDP6802434.1 F0F1 ATP synthase subunit B [Gemmatimonadota bacterium]MDP7031009.1 F0F1 ATP synthase subunit B [Gemmatimonadota bacterium]